MHVGWGRGCRAAAGWRWAHSQMIEASPRLVCASYHQCDERNREAIRDLLILLVISLQDGG